MLQRLNIFIVKLHQVILTKFPDDQTGKSLLCYDSHTADYLFSANTRLLVWSLFKHKQTQSMFIQLKHTF